MQDRWPMTVAALFAATALGATLYKWVDEKGVTHFADTPPAHSGRQPVDAGALPPSAPPQEPRTDPKNWRQLDDEFRERHRVRQEREDRDRYQTRAAQEAVELQKSVPLPGETRISVGLQRDVLALLLTIEGAADSRCFDHQVTHTEVLPHDPDKRAISERWTVRRCGKTIRYSIVFTPAAQGGITFSIRTPGEESF